ncbi:hypothetical protein AN9354.2 [Aspergillus nidulans FGSC A4]|uniref:NmrA-like domain-containing protein n=1 Tax=Emericella nidulans (strain FGSC A4 / ATCC 38163 / CBS 112.46 / NRRL 194 / M139) TaxID=227321 RepID=Q5AQS6_EMENI|nr:hypothetical protein [Aspergillus nidulans FGSC A4]EAA66421.1 hypothetical protein AN9354.2 [Aspergillus nidulans FGSC A4]CBF87461.1 TPA: conserved hypothetical protein [Aspergillus nidulans FGSC A4]|eukprot:XP_682623.1 hypothetical protein AN9354.2 [Aspergillus nidulans FGSC A4]
MSKVITVVGATGTQGGSVVTALHDLVDRTYIVRAITRNPSSAAAQTLLDKNIEVIEADLHDLSSLISAFKGSYAVFAVTNFFENLPTHGIEGAMELETNAGINLAKAAAATETLKHYVWSTLPDSKTNSEGRIAVPYYESKNAVDRYIRSVPELLQKTTFVWLGWVCAFGGIGVRNYVTFLGVDPATKVPLLGDEKVNSGLFVKAILDQPEKTLSGKTVSAVLEQRSIGDVVEAFGKAKGVQARCVKIDREVYRVLWPVWGDVLDISHAYLEDAGGKAFSAKDEEVLTKEDLGVDGLAGIEEAFEKVPLLG